MDVGMKSSQFGLPFWMDDQLGDWWNHLLKIGLTEGDQFWKLDDELLTCGI